MSKKSSSSLASHVTTGSKSEVNCELKVVKHSDGSLYLSLFANKKIKPGQELKLKHGMVSQTAWLYNTAHASNLHGGKENIKLKTSQPRSLIHKYNDLEAMWSLVTLNCLFSLLMFCMYMF